MIFERHFDSNYLSKPHFKGSFLQIFFWIVAMILFSLASWKNIGGASPYLSANKVLVFEKYEWWRLFTTIFVHGDMKHLMSNLLFFSLFANYVHQYFGKIVYPISALFAGALVNLITIHGMHPEIFLVGASGVVYYLGGFWLVIYLFIERHRSVRMRIGRSLGVTLVLLGPGPFSPETSYMAHFWGFVLGSAFAIIFYYWKKKEILRFERFRSELVEEVDMEDYEDGEDYSNTGGYPPSHFN